MIRPYGVWVKTFLYLMASLILVPVLVSAEADKALVNVQVRNALIAQMTNTLARFVPDSGTKRVVVRFHADEGIKGASYRVVGDGLIEMGTGGWVYIRLSSSHDHPEAGDIILAVDDQGRMYENKAHVCGRIVHFAAIEKESAADPDDFFTRFFSDIDRFGWEQK